MPLSPYSRARGAIWGACVGDALGGPVQREKPGTFSPIFELRYIKPFNKAAGYDDSKIYNNR